MELISNKVILRDFDETDFSFYEALETDPKTLKYESDYIPTKEELIIRFHNILELQKEIERNKFSLLIVDKKSNTLVGKVVAWKTNEEISEWEIGWFIQSSLYNKGYATEAAKLLKDYLFYVKGINRLQSLCHEENKASEKVMIKIGMQKEGTLRAARKLNGEYVNMLIYSIIKEDLD
ncbi:GNAT family N-acetyltransferase [Acholeplasma hippikon]|uniref:Spermidine N1-acetyltransferase n=1 Tax=Acholeplasma hippikon TaxID=264636 RepID=A0A449BI92_9MOLU|nr:GNAT family protein [Acholeplasma hippikon]VEU82133.1 spermidine N1-acetyltransferase [Acholeplasma hippikon]